MCGVKPLSPDGELWVTTTTAAVALMYQSFFLGEVKEQNVRLEKEERNKNIH
jgi:hypothetical protein